MIQEHHQRPQDPPENENIAGMKGSFQNLEISLKRTSWKKMIVLRIDRKVPQPNSSEHGNSRNSLKRSRCHTAFFKRSSTPVDSGKRKIVTYAFLQRSIKHAKAVPYSSAAKNSITDFRSLRTMLFAKRNKHVMWRWEPWEFIYGGMLLFGNQGDCTRV